VTAKPLKKNATYDDLVRVPEHYVAEMFDGELYASPRPAFPHARAAGVLHAKLGDSFDFGDGPGGWLIFIEPELHFGNDVLVPDLAGWRRERLPSLPNDAYLTLAPDWICEVLSPSTEYIDRGKKLRIYAREGVAHAWLVDPLRQSLEVLTLESGSLEQIEEHYGTSTVRARPFDAIELTLRALWI
jgi:Uma2 family endonuclease